MKRENQKDKFTLEELDNWDEAVNILNNYECQIANLNFISTNKRGFFLFWNNETKKLISSFWLELSCFIWVSIVIAGWPDLRNPRNASYGQFRTRTRHAVGSGALSVCSVQRK